MISFRQIAALPISACVLFTALGVFAVEQEALPEPGHPLPYSFEERHMGTLVRITLFATGKGDAEKAARSAFDRIADLNQKLSDYLPESELRKLCEQPAGKPSTVSEDLFAVLSAGKALAEKTDGAFDVTSGYFTNLWRRAKRKGKLPEVEDLDEAREKTGFRFVELDPKARTVTFLRDDMLLDLGGIAKGYAADAALAVLRKSGQPRASVAIGGDIAIGDPPPGATGWPITVSSLDAPEPGAKSTRVRLANCGISTSGDTRQFVVIDGKRYSHIVDPRTGLGLTERIGVNVIAPSATESDSLATAASVLGWDRGSELISAERKTFARFVRKDAATGGFEIKTTPHFPSADSDFDAGAPSE